MKKGMNSTEQVLMDLHKKYSGKRLWKNIFLLSILVIIIIVFFIIFFLYFYNQEKQLRFGTDIENVLISEDGKVSYVKLKEVDENVTKIKVIFKDGEGNEFYYYVAGKEQDYEINASDIGLENFNNIGEIDVIFDYETGKEADTKDTTTIVISGGGGGGGGGGSDDPPPCNVGSWIDTTEYRCFNLLREIKQIRDVCPSGTEEQWISNNCSIGYSCYEDAGALANLCINDTQSCIDSDGFDYNVNGSVNLSGVIYLDTCLDSINVTEYSCYYNSIINQSEVKTHIYNCSNGCLNGACQGPSCINDIDCDDLVSCTDDVCTAGSCTNTVNDGLCGDGLFCNGQETCDALLDCQAGTSPNLNDSIACTIDSCDEINDIIVNTLDHGFCDNGLWCDRQETCDAVLDCQAGSAQVCNDLISCTTDSCDEINDECDYDTSGCSCFVEGPAPIECDDSNSCTDDVCNSLLECENINNDANSCDQGLLCTENDVCSSGSCIADDVNVDDGIACTIDLCDEIDGITHIGDNDLCDDNDVCTNNVCNVLIGCEFPFNTAPCDDLVACTENDICSLGSCAGIVNDSNCQAWEYCDAVSGCVQSDCSSCDDCDDWWLWDDCSYDECHNSCNVFNECYFVGEILGSENCVDLNDACLSINVCLDYSEEECVDNPCNIGGALGCNLDEGNCVDKCTNDTGCSSVGSFCNGDASYNCTLGIDGCLDRTNLTDCGDSVFNLYTANLDGSEMKLLASDSYRQMTHARISPDKEWVAFTRYNNIASDNCSKESDGYFGTEIVLMRINGSDVRTIIPHEKDKISGNSYWTPDGGLIYASLPNKTGNSQINHIIFDDNMEIENISKIPIPENVSMPTDPHWRGDWIVFPATDPVAKTRGIYRIKYNGTGLEQLTWPNVSIPMGDNDPKISPDETKVAFLRQVKEKAFHAVVVDVNTKEEIDLSEGYFPEEAVIAFDGPPEWSSDGEFLIFPHWFVNGSTALFEIHMIRPDGSGRKKVPLPQEYVYHHTAFFPNEGSDDNTKIIFSARKKDLACRCTEDSDCLTHPSGNYCNISSGQCVQCIYDVDCNVGETCLDGKCVEDDVDYERINIMGETAQNGVYDISIEYDEKGVGWMAYTAMDWVGTVRYLHTHLAKTTDNGKTWTYVKKINAGEDGNVTFNGTEIEGIWRPEVPTLIYDPDDPGKEWKLFWQKYFCKLPCNISEHRMSVYGWIAYKYAPDPAGPWSKEVALFGGLVPLPPFTVEINLSELHLDLEDVVTYAEPGSLLKDGMLYLSLQAIKDGGKEFSDWQTILISSDDHGNTWNYVGTLTDYLDADDLGAGILTASSLAQENGRTFLIISPTRAGETHIRRGTYVFEFEDITEAKLKRNLQGKLIVHKYLKPSIEIGDSGESDYDEQNTYGGIVICQSAPEFDPVFGRIFNTREGIVEELLPIDNIYYVSSTGAGGHDGSIGNEFNLSEAQANASARTDEEITFLLDSGNYGDFSLINMLIRNPGKWVTYKANSGQTPVFDRISISNSVKQDAYLKFDGIKVQHPVFNPLDYPSINFSDGDSHPILGSVVAITRANHVQVLNCGLNGSNKYVSNYGVSVSSSDNVVIRNCETANTIGGIFAELADNFVCSNNHIHAMSEGSGIRIQGLTTRTIIEGNHVHDQHGNSSDLYYPYIAWHPGSGISIRSSNVIILNNTIHDGFSQGMMFYSDAGIPYNNMTVENNLFYDTGRVYLYNTGTDVSVRNNTFIPGIKVDGTGKYDILQRFTASGFGFNIHSDYDGSGIEVYNNVITGNYGLPSFNYSYTEDYNIFWVRGGTNGSEGGKGSQTITAVWRGSAPSYALHGYPNYFSDIEFRGSTPEYNYSIDGITPFFVNPGFYTAEALNGVDKGYFWDYHPLMSSPVCDGSMYGATKGVAWAGALPCTCTTDQQCIDVFGAGDICDIQTGKCSSMPSLSPFIKIWDWLKAVFSGLFG